MSKAMAGQVWKLGFHYDNGRIVNRVGHIVLTDKQAEILNKNDARGYHRISSGPVFRWKNKHEKNFTSRS